MTYKQWLEGDCGCGNVSPCSHKDVCDCENILLELEKQHVDDLTLQDEIDYVSGVVETISGCTGGSVIVDDELSLTSTNPVQNKVITGALNGKLDSSAYTPTQYTAGEYITIDSANTISTSGLVTVVDNEVPAFSAETLVSYYGGFPSSSSTRYSYDDSEDYVIISLIPGSLYRNYIKIEVIDSGGTKTSGETSGIKASSATIENVNPLPNYLTVESADTRVFKYIPNEGYRVSHASNRITYDGDPAGYSIVYVNGTTVTYDGGQSENVIENTVLPELANKGNKLRAANDTIDIFHDNISGEDRIRVNTDTSISSYYSGSTNVPTTKAVYNALQSKVDTSNLQNNYYTKSEVNNLIANKIQCLSEAEWQTQSGSTVADTLYLIY